MEIVTKTKKSDIWWILFIVFTVSICLYHDYTNLNFLSRLLSDFIKISTLTSYFIYRFIVGFKIK